MRIFAIVSIRVQRAIVYESVIEKIIKAFLKHQPEAQNEALLETFECLGNMQALNDMERSEISAPLLQAYTFQPKVYACSSTRRLHIYVSI